MAETFSTRMGLIIWGAGTDGPTRAEFNTAFAQVELLTAIDKQDTFVNRPSPGVRGTYFWDTTNEFLWRDNGVGWKIIGQKVQDNLITNSAVGVVPLTINAVASQSVALIDAQVNSVSKFSVSAAGSLTANIFNGKSASLINDTAGNVVIYGKGAASQSANLLRLENNAGTSQFNVASGGLITSTNFSTVGTGTSTGAVVGATTPTTVAGFPDSRWTGTPALEVRMNKASGYNDFLLLKQTGTDGSAVTRRFGILMKTGAEDAAGADHSSAFYMLSSNANFDSPLLRVDVANNVVWEWTADAAVGSTTAYKVRSNAHFDSQPPTTNGALKMNNTWIGTQDSGNSVYFRAIGSSATFNWFQGGNHSTTLNDSGGGTTLATLNSTGFTTTRLAITNTSDVSVASTTPPLLIGSTSGQNLQIDNNEIMGINNGAASDLSFQLEGGQVNVGGATTLVTLQGRKFWISSDGNGPSSPNPGDLWIDVRAGQGLKYRNVANAWVTF